MFLQYTDNDELYVHISASLTQLEWNRSTNDLSGKVMIMVMIITWNRIGPYMNNNPQVPVFKVVMAGKNYLFVFTSA